MLPKSNQPIMLPDCLQCI